MSLKSNKRVSFSDQQEKFTTKDLTGLYKENQKLRERIAELESTQIKSDKCLSQYQENIENLQNLLIKVEELKQCNERNKEIIHQLQYENFQILKLSQKLKAENSELHLKKHILETEIEKLSQTVFSQEIQLKKANLIKNTQTVNPVYRLNSGIQNNFKSRVLEDRLVDLQQADVVWGKGKKKKPEITVGKMKNLSIKSMSCKNFGARSFSFGGTGECNEFERNYHLEELKRLIKQTKDCHSRYKSVV